MIQIHEFKTLALPSFPIQNFFFIFNSYSHTHSNLKRASSIPKLFYFHIYFFNSLIRTYSTSILHFIQIHEFETLSFFFLHAFFFFFYLHFFFNYILYILLKARVRFPSFFSFFFHSFVHTYFTITYTRHMLLKHGFDSQVFCFFFTHFLLHVLVSSIILLTFNIFFYYTFFFSLHTLLYYYYFFFIFFIPFYHSHK